MRYAAQRAYEHGTMKQACRAFSGTLPASVAPLLPSPVSADLRVVADAFILLQDARHEADYNVARRFTRQRADTLVSLAENAFAAYGRVQNTREAKVFLISLLLWKQWNRP